MIELKELNKHPYALWFLGRLFDKQAQKITILEVDSSGLVIELRTSLQKQQIDRLFVREINESMIGYNSIADHANRKLTVTLDAIPARKAKSTKDSGQVAA